MPSKAVEKRLRDILENATAIQEYTADLSLESFMSDRKTRGAVERCFERIAEAARKIGPVPDEKHPSVEFARLRSFGSVLRHDYDDLDTPRIWSMVERRLPALVAACRKEPGENG